MEKFLQLATVLVVCLLTWMTTNSLLAQQRGKSDSPKPKSKTANSPKPKDKIVITTRAQQSNNANVEEAQIDPVGEPFVASTNLTKYDATVIDGRAFVTANVTMTDRRTDIFYIWRLKIIDSAGKPIVDSEGKPVADIWYDEQIFEMQANGAMKPTFNDVIQVPAGKSMVQLSLYEFPKGSDVTLLKDAKTSGDFQVLRGVKKVTN